MSAQPLLAHAQPTYSVVSERDFPKLPGSGTECKSTEVPNNSCTLRAAIDTVNTVAPGATITIPDHFVITLDPTLGELGLAAAMNIASEGGGATVDGGLQTRVFHIMSGTTGVIVSDLTVRRGKVTSGSDHSGGGIWNEGTLTLNKMVVTLNEGKNAAGIADDGTLTINASTISANAAIRDPASGEVAVAGGLGVKSGGVVTVNASTFTNNSADFGGGIGVFGSTTLSDVVVRNNTASQGGGGIIVASPSPQSPVPDLTVRNSSISGNAAGGVGGGVLLASARLTASASTLSGNQALTGSGGGIFVSDSTATLTNDTLAGNAAGQGGGGIAQSTFNLSQAGSQRDASAALAAQAKLVRDQVETSSLLAKARLSSGKQVGRGGGSDDVTLSWVTLARNSAEAGGGILNGAGLAFTARDSIVAQNTGTAGADCYGSVISGGYNLESSSDCGFDTGGDQSNSDPKLEALANNGGRTQTMALQPGSPAIDAGDPGCPPPTTDQRGFKRPQGSACDIGAFEAMSPPVPAPPSTGHPGVPELMEASRDAAFGKGVSARAST